MRVLPNQRVFPIVLVLTLAVALLPGQALGWVRPLAEIAELVLTPFVLPLNALAEWLRPQPSSLEGVAISRESLLHFQEEAARYEQLYVAEQARADDLERQLQQLQNAPADMPRLAVRNLVARIAVRPASEPLGAVTLNKGAHHGVSVGAVAVYNHRFLLGWVKDVQHSNAALVPLANKQTRPFEGALFAKDVPGAQRSIASAPRLGLEPVGNGTFIARPDRSLIINVGDEVVMVDHDWPTALSTHIGAVERITPYEKDPLRNIVIVRPRYQLTQVSIVVLRLESEDEG